MKKKTILAILAGIMVIASGSTVAPGRSLIGPAQVRNLKPQPIGNPSGIHVDWGSLPLYFTANKGQVDGRALFYAKAARYTLWLTEEGLVFDSFKSERLEAPPAGKMPSLRPEKGEGRGYERDVSRLVFLNASKHPQIVPVDETALKVNYFIGNDPAKWHTAVPTSGAVLYRNIYDRIDLKVYGTEGRIEYDWIVKPGGNPGDIRFEYKNVKGTRVDEAGNLLIETGFGELVHKKPAAYQEAGGELPAGGRSENGSRVAVESAFKKIGENAYGFEVGAYEEGLELVIDPVVLAYSTYLGGSGDDIGMGIAVDGSGNAYVTGQTYSANFPTLNQYQTFQGVYNAFVTKIDTTKSGNASLVYSTYLGGSGFDRGYGIAVDGSGNAYVTGYTSSKDFPTLNQFQTYIIPIQMGGDAFVTKIDTTKSGNASLVYSTYLGGSGADWGNGIAVDGSGNAYVTGRTQSTNFPTLSQYQTYRGGFDAFVTKIDTTKRGDASLVYSTYLGGNGFDQGNGIAVDGSGNAYVTGQTTSTNFPTLNQFQTDQAGTDAFVTKIDTTKSGNASLVYSTYLGGSGEDSGQGIAVDGSGNAYVTGQTTSTNFPTLNQYQIDPGDGNREAFVTKIDTTKNGNAGLVYSTYLGGSGDDLGCGIAADGSGNAYVIGQTTSTNFPILSQYQTYQSGWDAFVTKIDTTKSGNAGLVYSTFLGGSVDDGGFGIAVGSGNAYVTGYTTSTDFPTLNQYQTDPGDGNYNAFITKISAGNSAPVAICQDIRRPAGIGCLANAEAQEFNNGSYDPDGDPLTFVVSPVGPYPLGNTDVTLTVTDSHGAKAYCAAKITVYDDTPPRITSLAADPNSLWPANHKMVPVSITLSAFDNCSTAVTSKIVSVTSNEPVDGLGDGDTAPDWLITGLLTLNLRAERSGTGTGRIYTITIECRDAAGNKATGIVTVRVPHDQGK
jgi:soluble cytochrome b562